MDMPSFHIGGESSTFVIILSSRLEIMIKSWIFSLIKGQYDVEGMALVIFPIYGRGPFSLDIDNFQINGHGQLGARLNGSLVMRSLDFTMEMESMEIKFEGLLGGLSENWET